MNPIQNQEKGNFGLILILPPIATQESAQE